MRIVWSLAAAAMLAVVSDAAAQQSFSFSLGTETPRADSSQQAPLAMFAGKQLDPMSGIEVSMGKVTVTGLEDSRFARGDGRQSHQAELLTNLWRSRSDARVAIGMGVRHESSGTNVALTQVVAEVPALAGRLVGNVSFERPFAIGRDSLDVLTTIAYSKQITKMAFLGAEGLLQDVEGFWNPQEAEGGARLFLGPALDVVMPSRQWRLHVTGGRDFRATNSVASSDAYRALGHSGTVIRASASYGF